MRKLDTRVEDIGDFKRVWCGQAAFDIFGMQDTSRDSKVNLC